MGDEKTGRPTKLTIELAEQICELIATGHSLRQIEKQEGMPAKGTILSWNVKHSEEYKPFQDLYAQACNIRAELWAEEIIDIADDGTNDWYNKQVGQETVRAVDHENINRSRLRVDSRKWLLSKALPKKFGERITQEHVGAEGGPIAVFSDKPLTAKEFEKQYARAVEEDGGG